MKKLLVITLSVFIFLSQSVMAKKEIEPTHISVEAQVSCYEYGEMYDICPELLMAMIESESSGNPKAEKSIINNFWGLSIDSNAHEVKIDNEEIMLTLKEFKILEKLLENTSRVYSREQLLDDVWGIDYFGDTRTVDSHVARLRTKLGEWGNIHLKTVYGIGYKIQENSDGTV